MYPILDDLQVLRRKRPEPAIQPFFRNCTNLVHYRHRRPPRALDRNQIMAVPLEANWIAG